MEALSVRSESVSLEMVSRAPPARVMEPEPVRSAAAREAELSVSAASRSTFRVPEMMELSALFCRTSSPW